MSLLKQTIRNTFTLCGLDIDRLKPRLEYVSQKRLVKDARVIFDVGGHIGQTVEKYRAMYPEAEIYSFEPFEEAFRELEKVSRAAGAHAYKLALSDQKGRSDFFVNEGSGETNSLFPPEDMSKRMYHDDDTEYANTIKIPVPTDTIDSFCASNNIKNIDILKMDIQGGELKALKGAERMLKEKNVRLIFLEVSFIHIYKDQPLFHEIQKYLARYDYDLYDIFYLSPSGQGQLVAGDAIFLSPELRK